MEHCCCGRELEFVGDIVPNIAADEHSVFFIVVAHTEVREPTGFSGGLCLRPARVVIWCRCSKGRSLHAQFHSSQWCSVFSVVGCAARCQANGGTQVNMTGVVLRGEERGPPSRKQSTNLSCQQKKSGEAEWGSDQSIARTTGTCKHASSNRGAV